MPNPSTLLPLKVAEIRELTPLVRWLRLEHAGGQPLPGHDAGAHIRVRVDLPDGGSDWRHYSLIDLVVDAPAGRPMSSYTIAVRREDAGRGGSRFMHALQVGQALEVEPPRNDFPLGLHASTVLLAGGIGVTPIMSMAADCLRRGAPVRMVYAGRDPGSLAFVPELQSLLGERLRLHVDAEAGGPLDVVAVLDGCAPEEHVYVCGPQPMLDAVLATAEQRGWARERVHFELFTAPAAGAGDQPFEVVLAQAGITLTVPADRSLLDCLIDAGQDPLYDCQRGECGVCAVTVIEGVPDHRDYVLNAKERESGTVMHPCVSRCQGKRLVLEL